NVGEEPWERVQLTLATGAPLSFTTHLRTPRFVERPDAGAVLDAPAVTGAVGSEHAQAADRDHDGIADDVAGCPDHAETRNGWQDDDGWPDRGRVVVSSTKIEILESIHFAAGSAAVPLGAAPVLDAVAATLRGNPEIRAVAVDGHAAAGEA